MAARWEGFAEKWESDAVQWDAQEEVVLAPVV